MATKNIVPRGNLEGNLGTEQKRWSGVFVGNLDVSGNTKLTFANGTITDIATQAEAEAGISNTKVITPKGVDYRLNKDRQIKTYTSFSDIGLSNNATWEEIANALPNFSQLIFYASVLATETKNYYSNLNMPASGTVTIIKGGNTTSPMRMEINSMVEGSYHYAKFTAYSNMGFSGWKKLATNGALSMPSINKIEVSIPAFTANNTAYQELVGMYVAPADGWVAAEANANNNDSEHILYLWRQNHISFNNTDEIPATERRALRAFIPVAKEASINVAFKNISELKMLFYYAQSEV